MNYQISLGIFALLVLVTDISIAGGKGVSGGTVSVRGYVRKDGTYVQPHQRTAPDGSFQNNWSTYGNYNPYTGEEGKVATPPNRPFGSNSSPSGSSAYLPTLPVVPSVEPTPPQASDSLPPSSTQVSPLQSDATLLQSINAGPATQHSKPFPPSSQLTSRPPTYIEQQKQRDEERSQFWAKQGYLFNPAYMTAYSMDQKVKDIERAKFWQSRGYSFNPEYMTAYSMDQKVKDMERAKYWQERGYTFSPEYMTAYSMDQKVRDIERARYWKSLGLNFNPEYMSAYSMDREAERLGPSPR